jgi:glycolate oxidase subunit GlcD
MSAQRSGALAAEFSDLLGESRVLSPPPARYLSDATETRGLTGTAEVVLLPRNTEEVAEVMRRCYERDIPLTPRGGGTGYAGGAIPSEGAVLSMEDMREIRSFEPQWWRAQVEAGLATAHVHRLALENGLYFPPDPGAAELSQIGGNVATNAGGPHAFKYGVTGAWVTGLEAVLPPGEVVHLGGALRKDVAGYDLKSLLIGSEGTLAVITAVHLRLIPAPEARYPVMAFYRDAIATAAAIEACLSSGVVPAALEYLDDDTIDIVRPSFPGELPAARCFAVISEVDGAAEEARAGRSELIEAMSPGALGLDAPDERARIAELWRWRDGIGLAADAHMGGKVSEDVVVPADGLTEAVSGTKRIGFEHGLATCSWGHAGDGNLHSTFLFDRNDAAARARAARAAEDLFALAIELGGSVSGEHGIGLVKSGQLSRQWAPAATRLHAKVKELFDPQGLLNPGKKAA